MKTKKFSVIKSQTIQEIINSCSSEIFNVIKSAYIAHHNKKVVNPNSCFLRFPDFPSARIIALPAAINEKKKIAGLKWIASNPENLQRDLPRASAVILLNQYETGFPYACLEGAMISAIRTVYSAILAGELLKKNKKTSCVGVIGTGFIASQFLKWIIRFGWEIDELHLYDLFSDHAIKFKNSLEVTTKKNFQIHIHSDFDTVIKNSELIIFTTTAIVPYVNNPTLFSHNPIVLHLSLRDLDPSIIIESNNFVDDVENVLDANTSLHLTYTTMSTKSFINGTIGQLLHSECQVNQSRPVIFSPMGMGMLDVALADFVYEQAVASKKNIEIHDFFS